jgi:hypothetical protein
VCGTADDGRRGCATCGWTLTGGWLTGAGDADGFRRRLDAAMRRFDAVASARAFGDRRPAFVRGGVPDDAEWSAAEQAAVPDEPTPVDVVRRTLSRGLTDLDARPPTLVEVDAGGITALTVAVDELGTPSVSRGAVVSWPTILPVLSRDPDRLRFQLAGGRTGLDGAVLDEAVLDEAAMARALPDLTSRSSGPAVVACTLPGWPVPEAAAAMVRKLLPHAQPVRPEGISAAALLAELVAALPLIRAYDFVGAVVDPLTNEVRIDPVEIFAAGSRPGHRMDLAVRRPPGAREGTVLAAIARHQGRWAPVEVCSADLGPEVTQVSAVLDGPGKVRFVAPADLAPEPRGLDELVALVPERLTAVSAADLVCGVELCGTPDTASRRRAFVAELLRILADERRADLRVAVLGYLDHRFFDRTPETAGVVHGTELGSVRNAANRLIELPSPAPYYPERAPIEDMLNLAVRHFRKAGATGRTRTRVLLTVGGRVPHPTKIGQSPILLCPRRLSWRSLLDCLRMQLDVACFAVVDRPQRRSSSAVWRRLGAAGLYDLATADPRQVAMDMGVLAGEPNTLPFPLITPRGASS